LSEIERKIEAKNPSMEKLAKPNKSSYGKTPEDLLRAEVVKSFPAVISELHSQPH
jgi:hypothetical protein